MTARLNHHNEPRLVCTPEVQKQVLAVISLGFSERIAAQYAGVSQSTVGNLRLRDATYKAASEQARVEYEAALMFAYELLCENNPTRLAALRWLQQHGFVAGGAAPATEPPISAEEPATCMPPS